MEIKFVLLFLGAYLLGSVPAAYIAARLSRGVDIRNYGSGNVGGSNLWRVASKRAAIPAFVFDVAKGALPVFLAKLTSLSLVQQVVIGLAAIAGHNWSVYLRFSGGRGIATTLGVTLVLMPKIALTLLGIVVISIPFHLMAVVSIIALAGFPLSAWLSKLPAMHYLLGWSLGSAEKLLVTLALTGIPLIALAKRLLAPRSEFTKTVSPAELLINRLLYDRDIQDGKAWVNRNLDSLQGKK